MSTARHASSSIDLRTALALAALALFCIGAAPPVQAQTYSVIYNLGTNSGDPITPTGPFVQGRDGSLHGGAIEGADHSTDQIFRISPAGALTVESTFGVNDSGTCGNGLTLGRDGNFYGVCQFGNGDFLGYVYRMTPAGVVTVLHHFTGVIPEGTQPNTPPIQGNDGNFYGMTSGGGASNFGTVYKMTPTGTVTTLHGFTRGTDGATPTTPLVLGNDGNFYGGTVTSIFKITASGKVTVVHDPNGGTEGSEPVTLVLGADGSFYGTTLSAGANNAGTFFKVTASGTYTVLHNFSTADGLRGGFDYLMQATDGNFYGAELNGFGGDQGTLYKVTTKGVLTVLHSFGGTDGSGPRGGMFQNTNGILYGDTKQGGSLLHGVVYEWNANLAPFARLELTSGKAATSIGIFGQGFLTATGVTFGGIAGTFTAAGDNYMTATIPSGGTSGPVVVLIPSGNLTSSKTFKLTPVITSFTPPSGPVGTVVTVTGTGLVQASKVTFGGVAATKFTVNSGTQVTATVPVGGKTGKIAITTPGGIATSTATFTVH